MIYMMDLALQVIFFWGEDLLNALTKETSEVPCLWKLIDVCCQVRIDQDHRAVFLGPDLRQLNEFGLGMIG